MKTITHKQVNMEWTAYTPDTFKNLNTEQCAALAKFFTAQSRKLAEAEFAESTLEMVIEKLTGLDSVEACVKAQGADYIALSRE